MTLQEVLGVALRIGEMFLANGAEIYRAQMAINKVLEAYNIPGECFVITTVIFVTVYGEKDGTITRMKIVRNKVTNLGKLEMLNQLSRELWYKAYSYEEIMNKLNGIENIKGYPISIRLLASACLCFSFAFFFEATVTEAMISGIVGALVCFIHVNVLFKYAGTFLNNFVIAVFISAICVIIYRNFPTLRVLQLIIGSIMIIVPGSAITNGMKDALNGDIISSGYSFAETTFVAVAIGSGISLVLSIMMLGG